MTELVRYYHLIDGNAIRSVIVSAVLSYNSLAQEAFPINVLA